jgi:integrase
VIKGKMTMSGKLTARSAESLAKRKGRWLDGDGLFLRTLEPGQKTYWVYRYRLDNRDRETSVGSFPAMTLAQARIKHADLRAQVLKGIDPVGERRKAKAPKPISDAASFGAFSDAYVERKEKRGELGKNPKHRQQWRNTLAKLPAWFRDLPVDEIGPQQIFEALDPIWAATPETGGRLRGRIGMVLDSARKPDDTRPNPAAWAGWLKLQLGSPRKLGKIDRKTGERVKRGNHSAMPHAEVPAFMAKLAEAPGGAAKALAFTILTCSRSSEALRMTWDEVDFDKALWTVPADRMKMDRQHEVPLSDQAIAILRAQDIEHTDASPFVFPGARPKQPLSNMSMAMLLRRLGVGQFTVHGFRASARSWMAEVGEPFELAEACLAHSVGNAVVASYLRTTMLPRRRETLIKWATFCDGVPSNPSDNVVPINRGVA